MLPYGSTAERIILIGIESNITNNRLGLSKIGSYITSELNKRKIKEINIYMENNDSLGEDEIMLLYGMYLNSYRFNKYFSHKKKMRINYLDKINIYSKNLSKIKILWNRYYALVEGIFLTRDLVSEA